MDSTSAISQETADWPAIIAVTLGISAFGIALGLTYPLISLILTDRGYGETVIGLNAGVYSLGLVTATLLMPYLTRLMAGPRLIVLGLIASAIAIVGFALLPSITAWFVLRFVLGLGINLVFVLGEAWLNAACPDRMRGRVTAVYTAAMSAGFATGPLGVPLFGKEDGFGFAAGAALVALIAIVFALLTGQARVRLVPAPHGALLAFTKAAPSLLLMIVVFSFVDAAAVALFPVYFVDKGLSEGWAATTITVLFFGVLGTMPLIGLGLDRLNRNLVVVACATVAALAAAGLPFVDAQGFILWPLLFILGGAFSGIYTCALTGLGERFKGGMLVAGSAMFALSYAGGGILGPTSIGMLTEALGPEAIPSFLALLLLATAAGFAWQARRPNSDALS